MAGRPTAALGRAVRVARHAPRAAGRGLRTGTTFQGTANAHDGHGRSPPAQSTDRPSTALAPLGISPPRRTL